jgi:hypothetical protein
MTGDIISLKTRTILRELLVGTTLRFIDDEFEGAGIACDPNYEPSMSGARRSRVEQYYHTLDFTRRRDSERFLQVCESYLQGLNPKESAGLLHWLERDGFRVEAGRIRPIKGTSITDDLRDNATALDAGHLQRLIDRMNQAVDAEPDLAIGTAKELIEACCKTILAERGKPVSGTLDIPELVKRTRAELRLMPDSIPEAAKGGEIIRRILSSLATIAQGVAELRTNYGSGHGRHGRARNLSGRHARLAAGAAATLATFLIETHKDRDPSP